MAAEDDGEGVGLLAMLDGGGEGEEELAEETPKGRALREFFEAGTAGDWGAAEAAFQRAYDMCAMKSHKPAAMEESDEEEVSGLYE